MENFSKCQECDAPFIAHKSTQNMCRKCYRSLYEMKSCYCTIYLITNLLNNKKYVGQTWLPLKTRFRGHCKLSKKSYLQQAILKYGRDNFSYQVITFAATQETADKLEQYFIDKYNTRNKDFGYNIKEGGSRGRHLPESIAKNREAHLGKKATEETKLKLSLAHKGSIPWNKGLPLPEELKQKLIASNTGKKRSEETKRKMSEAGRGKAHNMKKDFIVWNKGKTHTEDTKRKISEAGKGKKASASAIAKRSLSPEIISQILELNKSGLTNIDISRKLNIDQGAVGRHIKKAGLSPAKYVRTPEIQAKINASLKGRTTTSETRAKLSAAGKGKSWTLVNGKRVYSLKK